MKIRHLIAILVALAGTLPAATPVLANATPETCQTQYTAQDCNNAAFQLDKSVQNPTTKQFVDNLGQNDAQYKPGSTIPYRITIKNISSVPINGITVIDSLPRYTSFMAGPGKYSSKEHTLTFTTGNLKPQETQVFDLIIIAANAATLPQDQKVCVTNRARAQSGSTVKQDDAQVCIQNTVLGQSVPSTTKGGLKVFSEPTTTETPPTGPEALALIPLLGSGITGLLLRRKTTP